MQQEAIEQGPSPDGDQGIETEGTEQRGFSDTVANERSGPAAGETSERDPAWRPGDEPPGEGVYSDEQETSTGVEDEPEPEGPGI
jgi:hypothetical protein